MLILRTNFCKITFRSRHQLQNYFYNEKFPDYGNAVVMVTTQYCVHVYGGDC